MDNPSQNDPAGIPVLTDIVSLGSLVPPGTESATHSDSELATQFQGEPRAGSDIDDLVDQAIPRIMPELEKLARKTLKDLILAARERKSAE